ARHLMLVGRSAPSEAARQAVAELESMGAQIVIERADVSREADVARVLERIEGELPPLRGVVHAAGLLADATLLQLDRQRLTVAMAPKVQGAWNLHRLTLGAALDFFVLFSSAAALLGTPGQANYAAANAFLDALAHHRRARGLPALSINWGTWSGIGLAAAQSNRGARLAEQGLRSLSPAQGIAALGRILTTEAAQLGVMRFDVARWCELHPAAAASPFLSILRAPVESDAATRRPSGGIRQAILDASPREREELMEAHLRERVAQVLRLAPSRVVLGAPLKQQGMDSLMTLELRNRLESDLEIPVSATAIWNYPTISLLARHLVEQLSSSAPGSAWVEEAPEPAASGVIIEELARGQIESLLDRELAAIDELLTGD
ncbi:MAG: beta-ketoacyl reductase, partial [Longimicrobiaceae bacterium]